MRTIKILLITFVLPLMAFTGFHKYYISVTQVDYIENKESVQIISRIFIDDFEKLLRERYDDNIELAVKNEQASTNGYIEKYLKDKIKIKINGKAANWVFIGKEYDNDIMLCYIEIQHVKQIHSIEITNQVLFDLFEDQQNMIKTHIYSKQKGFLLNAGNTTAMLNFN